MMKDFKNISFDIIDLTVNASPDIYINKGGISFTKKVLEDLGYPANVQYCISAENKVFAIRVCRSNDAKSTPFSKPRAEQTTTLSTNNKNFVESVKALLKDSQDPNIRYKVTGHFDSESKTMFFDMEEAVEEAFR
ncbi:hypothetical protein [Scatolibacter rhodanostii]|uniref:hypothetical protein n=1 Tax=Scatolibacter rhodanostii TaxID=2014781 RepID=UPI000C08B45C|nr:hypothetical protein [Scatolibacter rhodanostii]